jgi:hypothetical protein
VGKGETVTGQSGFRGVGAGRDAREASAAAAAAAVNIVSPVKKLLLETEFLSARAVIPQILKSAQFMEVILERSKFVQECQW